MRPWNRNERPALIAGGAAQSRSDPRGAARGASGARSRPRSGERHRRACRPDPQALASIRAWLEDCGSDNLLEPLRLDAAAETWPVGSADAILCVNMVHISPWTATEGLMRGAGRLLPAGATLVLYGPYRRAGVATAPSNEAFDGSLKARNPEWGLRELEAVEAEAARHGLRLERVVEMPANNLTLVFRR
jgi:hypothetical protein